MAAYLPLYAGEDQTRTVGSFFARSKQLLLKLCLVVAALLLWQEAAWATHAMGGELTYTCLGNDRYLVTLNFYRDCNGVAAPTNCNNGLRFSVYSPECGANFTQCFPNTPTVEVITPICPTEPDRCNNPWGTWGVEKYTYSRVVDLSAYSSCTSGNWDFSWSLCCRNNAITSLRNPGNRQLYLDAELHDAPGLCNSSPTFTNSPAPFYCIGEQISYNPGAVDTDGDSLAYRLIAARGVNGSNIPYQNNYSAQQPIRNTGGANAVVLNQETGTMTVTPSVVQVAVVTYEVREYRNGVHIGTITRDVQFVIRACSGNAPPTATGINGTANYSMEVCAGTPVSFTIDSYDPNAGQIVTMGWNNGIPGATFNVSGSPHPTGTFTWTPTTANIGNNTFTVNVTDDGCPLVASNDYGFTIRVTPPATDADAGSDFSVCGSTATMNAVLPYAGLQGTWSVVSGSGTFTNPNSRTSEVTGLAQGENVFRWTVDYRTCGSREAEVTVTSHDPAQPAAAAGSEQSVCSPPAQVTLAANAAVAPAVGTWTFVNGSGTIADPNDPNTTVTGLATGTTRLRWTINNGPCGAPSQDEVVIKVYDGAQAFANAGSDISICTPQNSVMLNGNAATAPAEGTWTLVSGSGTITDPHDRRSTVTGLPVGVHVFRWTIHNGPCTPDHTSDEVTVTVYSGNSPAADAGGSQEVCLPGSVTMSASQPIAPSTGVWTIVSGSGTITSPNDPNTTVTDLGIGANVFEWTVNNGPCASGATSDQVTITGFDPSINNANAGADRSFCLPTTSVNMAANAVNAPAQGTWTQVSGTGTIQDIHSATTTITGLSVGENTFRWDVANGPCPVNPPSDEVSIFIYDDQAPAADAGPDQELCTPTTATTLAANAPVFPQTGQWTVVQGQGSFSNANDPNTTVVGLAVGQNRFRWTLDNGPCANPVTEDDVVITVYNAGTAVADAGPDQELCTPTSSTIMAGSAVAAPAVGTWTLVSGSGTIVSPNNPATQITGLAVGDNVFRWNVVNGPCTNGNTNDQVLIRVYDSNNPDAHAGADQELCTSDGPATLAGSAVVAPATGEWTLVSGAGAITDVHDPNTTVTGLAVGVNTFRWTVDNGSCGSGTTQDEVAITVYDEAHPAITAGPDDSICIPTSPNQVSVTGTTPVAPATGTWVVVSGSGTITNPDAPTTTITDMGVGENVFRWQVSNGPCILAGNSALVTITVFDGAMEVANAGPDQSLCTPITATTLEGSALIAPGSGEWTLVSGSGVFTNPNDPATAVTGLGLGDNVFQWTVDNGPCAAPTSDQVTITVNDGDAQQADAGPDQDLCSDDASTVLAANTAVAPATGVWSVQQGTATFAEPTSPTTAISGLSIGVNILRWSLDNGACGTSNDQVRITVYDENNPVVDAGPDQQLCTPTTSTTLAGSAVNAPAQGTWTLISGAGNIVSPQNPNTVVNSLGVGNNVFRWTVDNGACAAPAYEEVVISLFSGTAQAANAGPDQELCIPTTTATLAANAATGPAQGTWTAPSGITFSDIHDPQATVNGLEVGDNILTWTIDNGTCGSSSDQVNIRLFSADNAEADAGPDQGLCTPDDATTMAASSLTYPATGTWTLISGSGTLTDPGSPTSAVTGLEVGANVFRWTVSNGPCANGTTTSEVTITLYDSSVSGADAGPDREVCTPQSTVTMTASPAPAPAQGTWTLVSGGGTITDLHDPATTVTDLPVGLNIFRWEVSNGACPVNPPSDEVAIRVYDAGNPAADAGADQQLCIPDDATTLEGSALIFPAQGTWTVVQGGGTIVDANDPASAVTDLPVGVNIFEWTVSNGPCAGSLTTDRVSIYVYDPNSPAADAGADQSLCTPTTSATLAGNSPIAPATGMWSLVQGTANITNPTDPTTTVTGLGIGENILVWELDNGPCADGISTDTVRIFLFDSSTPNADAGPDQELCLPTTSATLAGSPVIYPAEGQWTVQSGSGAFDDDQDPGTGVSGLSVGANVFRWTVRNGLCSNSYAEVTIYLYDDQNPTADAGPDQQVCTPTDLVTMAASSITYPAQGTWTLVSGSGIISNPHSPTTNIIDLEVGTTILAWTVDNGPCAQGITSDTVVVEVFRADNPVADAGPDQDLCTPGTSTTLAGSTVTAPAIGTWSVVQGAATFVDPNDPSTDVTGLGIGVNVLRWTVDNGPCETGASFDEVTINLYDVDNPAADAGPDQSICTPDEEMTMAAAPLTIPATGQWVRVSGSGQIVDPGSPTTQITGLQVGENIFEWTVDNGPCSAPTTDLVSIFVHDQDNPVADAGADQQICTPVTHTTLAGSAITFPATGSWTLTSGQGIILDPADPHSEVIDLGVGVNVFTWTVDNGPCGVGVTSDQVSITLFDLNAPPADAGPDQSYCSTVSQTALEANTPTSPAVGIWSVSSGSGTFADENDPITTVTGLEVGENILTWSFDNGVCGFTSDNVSIFIFDQDNPPANAGPDQEYCTPQDSTWLQANTPTFPAFGTWTTIDGAGLFEDIHDPGSKVVGMAIGNNTFVWTTDNGPCPGAITTDTVTVIIYSDSTSAAYAGEDFELCLPFNSAQLQADVPQPPATGTWTVLEGAASIADPSDPHSQVSGLQQGITRLLWTLDNGPCPNHGILTDTLTITIYDPFAPVANAGPDIQLCTPEDSTFMAAATPDHPSVGTWELVSGTATLADIHDPQTAVDGLAIGINVFAWTVYNGNCGFGPPTVDTVKVYLYDHTAPEADAGSDQDLCGVDDPVTLAGNEATFPGVGTWTSENPDVVFEDPSDPHTMASNLSVGDNRMIWTIDNGPCGTSSDTVLIRVFDPDLPAANAGGDKDLCTPETSAQLAAAGLAYPATGQWSVLTGQGTFVDATDPQTLVNDLGNGVNTFIWTVDNGPCGILTDTVNITLYDGQIADAQAGPDQELCGPLQSTTLAASAVQAPASGQWAIVSGAGSLSDPNDPQAVISALEPGQTVLTWTIDNGPCDQGNLQDTVVITVYDGELAEADAGPDQQFCESGPIEVDMFAQGVAFPAAGSWSIDGEGIIADPTDPHAVVAGVGFGTTVMTWTVENGVCGTSSASMTIQVFDINADVADAGEHQFLCHDTTFTRMEALPANSTASGHWALIEGHGLIAHPDEHDTEVSELQLGDNLFVWTVDNGACGSTADTVLINLRDCSILVVPDAFSPNGDGVNDTYVVQGLEYYPGNSFQVFNRWGAKVYERAPYNNTWEGISEAKTAWGSALPESTYYFILDPGDGKEVITGYIYLRR